MTNKKQDIPKMAFVDYCVAEDCKNLQDSYGEICVKCGKCGRKFKNGYLQKQDLCKPMDYAELENKALEEFREKFNSAIDPDARGKDSVIEQFWKSHLKEAYEAGKKNKEIGVAEVYAFDAGKQDGIISERERIKKWAEKYMEETTKYYGTDKHGIGLEDLLQELNK